MGYVRVIAPAGTRNPQPIWVRVCYDLEYAAAEDWSGSAVDFVERGFRRFCKQNGADEAKKVWSGFLRIMDHPFEMTEQERNSSEIESPTMMLYLVGEYDAAASVPIGAALTHLECEHELLPAAFYKIFVHNLWKWMRVFDYSDALEHAEMWIEDLDEDSEAESVYPRVKQNIPPCLQKYSKSESARPASSYSKWNRRCEARSPDSWLAMYWKWILTDRDASMRGRADSQSKSRH